MKCRDCEACVQGWFSFNPDDYVCIGVKEPFVINDVNAHCTEYEWMRKMIAKEYVYNNFTKDEMMKKIMLSSCVEDFGIETEFSNICCGNCEECWNSRVVKLLSEFKR